MSELTSTSALAGWYPDPHGLPQQRWWTGHQWTHAVAPLPAAPHQPPHVTALPSPQSAFALPATPTEHTTYPTRRQLREEAARLAQASQPAEPHPAAPFTMPAAAPAHVPAPVIVSSPVASPPAFAPPAPSEPIAAAPAYAAFPPPAASTIVAPVAPAAPAAPFAIAAPAAAAPLALAAAPLALAATPSTAVAEGASAASWPFAPVDPNFVATHDVPYQPFGMQKTVTAGIAAPPDRVQTWEVWVIALMPVLVAAVGYLIITMMTDAYTTFMQGGIALIFILANLGLAVRDRRALQVYGHARTASPGWILLSPLVYLIIRSVRARGSAGRESLPLLAWIVGVGAIGAALAWMPQWITTLATTTGLF